MTTFTMPIVSLLLFLMLLENNIYVSAQTSCISSINALVVEEVLAFNLDVTRTYSLCGNVLYSIGKLDFYGNLMSGGQDMIPLRPNLHLKCGDDGRRESNCIVTAGDLLLDGTSHHGIEATDLTNVVIEGFTFVNAGSYVAHLTKPGSVLFRDCVFMDNKNALATVFADYFDPSSNEMLTVIFQKCDFKGNVYAQPGHHALVVGNGLQNRLSFQECRFEQNNMMFNNSMASTSSYLIESGGPLEMVKNCFENNLVGVAVAAVYNSFLNAGNYGNMNNTQNGGKCYFAAKFLTSTAMEEFSPDCVEFQATSCGISATFAPISPPTVSPTQAPTPLASASPTISLVPSLAPSNAPTVTPVPSSATGAPVAPSTSPSVAPTPLASQQPSATFIPTAAPSASPSVTPSLARTESPTTIPTNTLTVAPTFRPTVRPTNDFIVPRSPTFNNDNPVSSTGAGGDATSSGSIPSSGILALGLMSLLLLQL